MLPILIVVIIIIIIAHQFSLKSQEVPQTPPVSHTALTSTTPQTAITSQVLQNHSLKKMISSESAYTEGVDYIIETDPKWSLKLLPEDGKRINFKSIEAPPSGSSFKITVQWMYSEIPPEPRATEWQFGVTTDENSLLPKTGFLFKKHGKKFNCLCFHLIKAKRSYSIIYNKSYTFLGTVRSNQ